MRAAFPLALLLALVGTAAGAPAGTVEGRLAFDGPLRLVGDADVASAAGVLDLTALVQAGAGLTLEWDASRGWAVATNWTRAQAGSQPFHRGERPTNESLDGGRGVLREVACGEGCLVLLVGLGDAGTRVGRVGSVNAPLSWLDASLLFWAEDSHEARADAYRLALPPGTFAFDGDGWPHAEGRVALVARSARLVLEQDGEERVVDTRVRREGVSDALGLAGVERIRSGFAYLELDDATMTAARGHAPLYLQEGTMRLQGALDAAAATGTLHTRAGEVRLQGEPLRLDGDLTLDLARLDAPAAAPLAHAEAPRPEATMRGEATHLLVQGAAVDVAPPPRASTWAQLSALALVALAALAQRAGSLGLYTRITQSAVLENPRRKRVLDHVRRSPGATATQLARAAGMSRVLVQYHLRMLETRALVVGRADGRQTRWFLPDAAQDADALALASMLDDETRRRVAREIAAAPEPGVTQREVAARTGTPARLVSYHVQRLHASGLVRRVDGYPPRFAAAPRLATALAARAGTAGNGAQANDIAS